MKRLFSFCIVTLSLILFLAICGNHLGTVYAQENPTPTPTYDPLAEPFVPENPSEYELGRNWYWHNCMTCHGDVGQGLTDEFRAIWPEDHQNCWDHGCHGGRVDDEGFPIPTLVPALVSEEKLAQFASQQAFYEFLKSTHPPQDPGCLEDRQYQAIVKYVFNMNERPFDAPILEPTMTPALPPASTPPPVAAPDKSALTAPTMFLYIGLGIMLILVVLWGIKSKLPMS